MLTAKGQAPLLSTADRAPLMKCAVSIFVLWHAICSGVWMFPALDPQLIIWKPASSYIYFFGLWQNWSLFAPEPKKYNIHLSAVITFNSGKTTVCEFPRMEKLSVFERPWKERYRKWANENLYEEKFWPDAARFIARMHCSSNQVPVSVALVRHWSDIPPPRKPHVNASADSEQQNVFFTYKVAPGDLL